ncbi:MAG: DUF177 domain-containing protein, partial [Propionibacteriaceae bacterium]|nr:DUF177 domain-containing protein [Propionibacteriaceae bacterium]
GVWVTGTAEYVLAGQCARCLADIAFASEVGFEELFLYPGTEALEADVSRIDAENIDIMPLLHDQIVLELPFSPICQPGCAGLCQECGVNLNEHLDHKHEAPIDPRWEALARFDQAPVKE